MDTKSKDIDKDPITQFADTLISDPEINKKIDDMFDGDLPLASIHDLFDNGKTNEIKKH